MIQADAHCRDLAMRHYENFSVVSRLVPAPLRLDLMRFYAFCRTTDDFGDESPSREAALEHLCEWRTATEAMFAGAQPGHPVLLALRETVKRHGLDAQPFLDLIAANVQDQIKTSYTTWPELQAYCMLSAAPVGRVVLKIFGIDGADARKLSDDVCIGLQLANHAQDVSRDAKIGRSYLLREEIESRGTRGAVQALVERARSLLASGETLEEMTRGALRLQLSLYRLGGLAICDRIEQSGFRTDVTRPSVSKAAKVALLIRAALALARRNGKRGC
ncbi:MAG TPA: squalene/phytoene synthase family protein [Candidatus Rubrimentiphilum sp.]|nr:squalene/phytoene synthase family protein [Candidatus Rubrimentiphilum sp.]